MTVLAHMGALYALIDRSDAWHALVRSWWLLANERIVVPAVAVPIVTRVVARRLGPEAETALARCFARGEFVIEPCEGSDLTRAAALAADHEGKPLRFVDASIVAMAERLRADAILTTERECFARVKPVHLERFRLVP